MSSSDAYLQRVRNPNPLLLELARQVCDLLEFWDAAGRPVEIVTIASAAADAGVPLAYVLDERERRVRARNDG